MDSRIRELIRQCPKTELHYHIDNISRELFARFSKRNGMELPFQTQAEEEAFYTFRNLEEFLKVSLAAMTSIQTEEDFADMVYACAADMKRQNIVYREAMFDYTGCYGDRGIALKTVMNGFEAGLYRAREAFGNIDLRFIANMDRRNEADKNCAFLTELAAYKERIPLIAVGMDMNEAGYPARDQAKAFALAREMGFYLTGHTGEDMGPEEVWEALDTLHLDRIDHGVRSAEDERLLKRLAEERILLTLCPDSNISLGIYSSWEEYPLRRFLKAGVPVCINSDDPGVLPYDLTGNLLKCAEVFALSEEEIIALLRNGCRYNFAGREHLKEIDGFLK